MQSSSEQPLVGEERYVTTRITAAKETTLVQNFPSEFALVKLVDVKDLTVLAMDRRSSRGESVAVASLFGVVCAVTRRTIKSIEVSCHKRLIDAINELKIDLGRA